MTNHSSASPSWNTSSKCLLGLALIASALVGFSPLGAQAAGPSCLGLNAQAAAADGYIVQVGTSNDDLIVGVNGVRNFILGGPGADEIIGGDSDDIICGGPGNDDILGRQGDDRVGGNRGNDTINLGNGNDVAFGGEGDDTIVGDFGNDRLVGNQGNDRLSGETGDDFINGLQGDDVIFGGSGFDDLRGALGNDRIAGGPDDDRILAGGGNDIVSGDDGDDELFGQSGADALDGDGGVDALNGGQGSDRCDSSDGDSVRLCESEFAPATVTVPTADQSTSAAAANIQPPTGNPVPAAEAPQGLNRFGWPLLTNTGLAAMLHCESTTNHSINTGNGFFGGVQWIPATWDSAARLAGFDEYVGVLPNLVPNDVQDTVTRVWWEATTPNTQWPTCHRAAMEAMNVLAP